MKNLRTEVKHYIGDVHPEFQEAAIYFAEHIIKQMHELHDAFDTLAASLINQLLDEGLITKHQRAAIINYLMDRKSSNISNQ